MKSNIAGLLQDFEEQLAHHIVEKIYEDEPEKTNDIMKVHYLPHRPIIKEERETAKVRIVFYASSKIFIH